MGYKKSSSKDEKTPVEWVDLFIGSGATDLPEPEGIASTWWWPKAQVGNVFVGVGKWFFDFIKKPFTYPYARTTTRACHKIAIAVLLP